MTKYDCVVLAAGESRRMGHPKMLLDLHGAPLVVWAVRTALINCPSVIVVQGPIDLEPILGAYVEMERVRVITNTRFRDGQLGSLKAGLAARPGAATAVFVTLGDLPRIAVSTYRRLAAEADADVDGGSLIPVTADGTPGHPVLLSAAAVTAVCTLPGTAMTPQTRAHQIIRSLPHRFVPVADRHISVDIDTPSDIERLKSSSG